MVQSQPIRSAGAERRLCATAVGGVRIILSEGGGNGGPEAVVRVRDHGLDAAQAPPREFARAFVQNGPASDGPTLFTPTATVAATEMMRPSRRTFTTVTVPSSGSMRPERGKLAHSPATRAGQAGLKR